MLKVRPDKSKTRRGYFTGCAGHELLPRAQLTAPSTVGLFNGPRHCLCRFGFAIGDGILRNRCMMSAAKIMESSMPSATTAMASTARRPLARVNGLNRRVIWGAMLITAPMLVSGATLARATDWPAKPVTVVVGYAAGGNTDVMARMASKKLSEDLKQSFIVENRIGAGGALAA